MVQKSHSQPPFGCVRRISEPSTVSVISVSFRAFFQKTSANLVVQVFPVFFGMS